MRCVDLVVTIRFAKLGEQGRHIARRRWRTHQADRHGPVVSWGVPVAGTDNLVAENHPMREASGLAQAIEAVHPEVDATNRAAVVVSLDAKHGHRVVALYLPDTIEAPVGVTRYFEECPIRRRR